MTRKHFQLIADVVKEIRDYPTRAVVAHDFSVRLASTNPRFNRSKFIEACGVSPR